MNVPLILWLLVQLVAYSLAFALLAAACVAVIVAPPALAVRWAWRRAR